MKKILICVPSLCTGGAEKFSVDLALSVDKTKFKVLVAVTRLYKDTYFNQLLKNNGIEVVDLSGDNFLLILKRQLNFLRKEKPDVVHAQIGSILHMMIACTICHTPTRLYTVHNEAKLLYGKSFIKKQLYKLAFSVFKFVPIAICPTVMNTIIEDMGIPPEKVALVNNGVNTEKFVPCIGNPLNESINVISVGTLYWIKNQSMIIRSIVDLHNKGMQITLTLLGEGEDRKKIEREIKNLGAENYIFLRGMQKNVTDYLQKADIYVSASITEGLPLSILEAMACGLPVIATAVGGTVDIIRNEINGYLVSLDNQKEMEECLGKLCTDKDKLIAFGIESRKIAEEWSIENCIKGYENLYSGL